ncbi:asparagine synthase [Bacillus coahuilensis p1.1.43]|uniref:asparagine synthase (glutamine-hydrolyzing) n=1 Tax=Bacillus coahuilensis p1.1.43 TaxID=1150625 RepID=A0A147K926_9BACI|nr:asparagine synthase (glutamine-hydrolyzing) [Bacillus coahuilensis]KUP06852.1 asparagine synthase [Bacillus coahuilensis p1.1.43]
MCGFVGCIHDQGLVQQSVEEIVFKDMNNLIAHRGPDDEGYFFDDTVRLGFRRLSIIDLENGHQPLSYENERFWIIFNGEIYNYLELRDELELLDYQFETQSDTEVILAAFAEFRENCFSKLRGMFGIVIWDKVANTLFGARDPFGIKPFYYKEDGELTYFASEKMSLELVSNESLINRKFLQHYLSFQYIPEPYTLSKKIRKLEPGHYFMKKLGTPLAINAYWKPSFHPIISDQNSLKKEIREVMEESVSIHMRSDVPVGSFLSGGIDSTIIVALAKEFHPNIQTFSVGFERDGFSEIDVAKETADKLGVMNYNYTITAEEYMNELPKILWHMDDPLADPAAIPLYFVAREASKYVTVALSGEGADELFGGYNIYREPQSLRIFNSVPNLLKNWLYKLSTILPEGMRGKSFLERGCTPVCDRYIGNAKIFTENEKKSLLQSMDETVHFTDITNKLFHQTEHYSAVDQMQYIDMHTWLRGDILLKADRMTMAHSLELRVPFLDKEVFKVASKIPMEYKIANNTTKYILRQAFEGIIPNHVVGRKKLGFPVPIRHWLKNEMHDWAKNMIIESPTDHHFNKTYLLNLLDQHVAGKHDHSRKIWTVLMFMQWHQVYVEKNFTFDRKKEKDKEFSY